MTEEEDGVFSVTFTPSSNHSHISFQLHDLRKDTLSGLSHRMVMPPFILLLNDEHGQHHMVEMVFKEILTPQLLLGTKPIRAILLYPTTLPAYDPSCRLEIRGVCQAQ